MNGPRFNEFIQSPKVRVIDENGENLGVMYTREAMEAAREIGLDLVEVSPNADPPVAKYLDVGKYKYEAQKKANLARKSQHTQEIKEIKMRRLRHKNEEDFRVYRRRRQGEGDIAFSRPRACARTTRDGSAAESSGRYR
jgi:translation initiation factor IF-3